MELAALTLVLMLNGNQVDLAKPVLTMQSDDGTQHVMVPLREVFEAAGFAVEYRDRKPPYIAITGHVDRLPRRHLVRRGYVYPGRPEVRCEEYLARLPFAPRTIEAVTYVPAVVLRIVGGGHVEADLQGLELRWNLTDPASPPALEIGELLADVPRWLHRRVRIEGAVLGPEGDPQHYATAIGAPAPGAWAVTDGTGAICCTDVIWSEHRPMIPDPEVQFAQRVVVEGILRPGWGGLPYLSCAEVR